MSSFRDLQKIYEDYRGMSIDPPPNKSYAPARSRHSMGTAMPFNAGGPTSQYSLGAVQSQGPNIIEDEEKEAAEDDGLIEKRDVINQINTLQKQATAEEMHYAVHMLGLVKKFIRSTP